VETLEGMAEEDVANVLSGLSPHQAASVLVQVSPPARMCPYMQGWTNQVVLITG